MPRRLKLGEKQNAYVNTPQAILLHVQAWFEHDEEVAPSRASSAPNPIVRHARTSANKHRHSLRARATTEAGISEACCRQVGRLVS